MTHRRSAAGGHRPLLSPPDPLSVWLAGGRFRSQLLRCTNKIARNRIDNRHVNHAVTRGDDEEPAWVFVILNDPYGQAVENANLKFGGYLPAVVFTHECTQRLGGIGTRNLESQFHPRNAE